MDMLKAMNILKEDLKTSTEPTNRISVRDKVLTFYSQGRGIPKGRIIQFYGKPDCGKTSVAKEIIRKNHDKAFVYISSKKDDINKIGFMNTTVLLSNIFENTINYISRIQKDCVDFVVIDNINNMVSKEELLSAFTKQTDNREILNRYIKKLSLLAAQKNFSILIFNGINGVTNKAKYGHIIEKEAIANFEVQRLGFATYRNINQSEEVHGLNVHIVPQRSLLSPIKNENTFTIKFSNSSWD